MSSVPHYLRLKPRGDAPADKLKESVIESLTDTEVVFKNTTGTNRFSKIFNEVSQLDMYTATMQDMTAELFDEKDSVLFTLGPSNSGKSYSIHGDDSNPGLAIYSLNEIFNKIGSNFADYKVLKKHFGESFMVTSSAGKDCTGEYGLTISVFEIYNDRIRDLSLDQKKTINQSLDIITDVKDGKIKPNKIRQIYVSNLDEAKTVLHKCIKRRAVSATNLNMTSSRSHLFIYFNLHRLIGKAVRTTRLTVADLAGSERTKTAKTEGKEFKEGNYTNTSLTELGRCLALMKSKKFDRSILRTSKLTRLLLTDLFGNFNAQNRIKILLTLDPYSSLSTILHAIRYIQPVAKLQINSERNSLELNNMDSHQLVQISEEVKVLRAINEKLENDNDMAREKLIQVEMEVRRELSDQYETKIQELESMHAVLVNELKESHQIDLDTKLNMLSDDYNVKMKELQDKQEQMLSELDQNHNSALERLSQEHEDELNQLKQTVTESFESEKLEEYVSILQKDKDTLEEKLKLAIAKLDDAEKEINQLTKKEKRKSKQVDELTVELEDLKHKRKSETMEHQQNKKVRFSEVEEKDIIQPIDNKENNFADLLSLSPIKLIRTSPNKHFKFEDESPKVNNSPLKKMSFESPTKRHVLQDTNLDYTLPSPKIKVKSPSKGKKKLNQTSIVDTSMD